jgi:hypothetical protein
VTPCSLVHKRPTTCHHTPQHNSIQQISHDVKSLYQHFIHARCRTEQVKCLTIFP